MDFDVYHDIGIFPERRKQVEESLMSLRNVWERMKERVKEIEFGVKMKL